MNEVIARKNFDYCQQTIKLKSSLELSYLKMAERLSEIFDKKMWEPNYESFDEFLSDIKVSRPTATKLIGIWKVFVMQYKIPMKRLAEAGGWSVVAEILPYADTKAKATELLFSAKEVTRSDLRKILKEKQTGIEMMSCKHKNVETITFHRCNDCGDTIREYDEEKK